MNKEEYFMEGCGNILYNWTQGSAFHCDDIDTKAERYDYLMKYLFAYLPEKYKR